ncbi:MAG: RNA-binding protein [Clostridiales bacterium]|nr:RNA-binding protein [Clostridiales bacterium]
MPTDFDCSKLSDADKLLIAKIQDMIEICSKSYKPKYTAFLDQRQCALVESVLKNNNFEPIAVERSVNIRGYLGLKYFTWGGYEDAGRKILCIYDEYDTPNIMEVPIKCLTFYFRRVDKLSHRDFLGAIMALQVKREAVGDIIVAEGRAQVFVCDSVSDLLLNEIDKIGKVGVRITDEEKFNLDVQHNFIVIKDTVASLRLDAMVSSATKQSRERSAQLIKTGCVSVNYFTTESPSMILKQGDVFSARGYGKFVFSEINGTTKKGRIHIEIKKYM